MFTATTNLPFPQVPQPIIDHLKAVMENRSSIFTITNSSSFEIRNIEDEIIEWVRNNITRNTEKVFLQTIDKGTNFVPHVDPITPSKQVRHYNLMYLFETGGENVETCFYETPPDTLEKCAERGIYKIPYSDVKLISKFVFEKNTWNVMNNQCIHSVEGITGKRMGLSVSFYNKIPPDFLKSFISI